MKPRVLLVDDDTELCKMAALGLAQRRFDVRWLTSGQAAANALCEQDYDALVTDVIMADMDGLQLCRHAADHCPGLPVVLITAHGSLDVAIHALRAGADDLITKPFGLEELAQAIWRVTQERRPQDPPPPGAATQPPPAFGGLIGNSEVMRNLFQLLAQISVSDVPLLITGESGTGKEAAARSVHCASARCDQPFVAINCAAVPEALLESQLFGHLPGAFTDAKRAQRGLLIQADGGTLFLDEIGDMPLSLQPKLLRALQERTVRPLGSSEELSFDVRVIAATNQDLGQAISERRFREDLYYRLNVVHVRLPPLRERGEDVLLHAKEALQRFTRQLGKEIAGLSPAAARLLLGYPWPGNVREVQNCMQRAAALSRSALITEDDLPPSIRGYKPRRISAPTAAGRALVTLEDLQISYIQHVLSSLKGNKSLAAKLLGIDRATLYRKLARAQERSAERRRRGEVPQDFLLSLRMG